MGLLRTIPAVLWSGLMLYLLLKESSGLPKLWWLEWPHSDKVLHAGVFAVGNAAVMLASGVFGSSPAWGRAIGACGAWALGMALLTEGYQHCCVTTRTGEWADLAADLIGATVAFVAIYRWRTGQRQPINP